MKEKNEKIKDIIAEHRYDVQAMAAKRLYTPTAEYLRILLLDRIEAANKRLEAAHKREVDELKKLVGNAAKLREAAKHVQSTMERLRDPTDKNNAEFVRILEIVSAALAAPPRNCDVGTEDEQSKRLERYCDNYGRYCDGTPKCTECPLSERIMKEGGRCELYWAQMPYEEGGEK